MGLWTAPGGGGLHEVLPSAAAALRVAGFTNSLNLASADRIVVLLVDGLGSAPLIAALGHPDLDVPSLRSALASGTTISAPFPSTTPVGLASLGVGQPVGCHGIVGASFRLPETDEVLWPLNWRSEPHPTAVQPEPTVLERVAAAGLVVTSVSPRAFRQSGLTRAALRGGTYIGADSIDERVAEVTRVLPESPQSLTYVYWGELDKTGHVYGVDSEEWRQALRRVELLVAGIIGSLPGGANLLLTADHGMLDTGPDDRVDLDELRELAVGVVALAGEPRMRHVYCEAGAEAEVASVWTEALGGRATVLTRTEAIDGGWFGPIDPLLAERVGDVIAVASGRTVLASDRVDARASALIGQHGSASEAEMSVPLLTWTG